MTTKKIDIPLLIDVNVIYNHDGDTLYTIYNKLPLIVRLYGIDCPEVTKGVRLNKQAKDLKFPTSSELLEVGKSAKSYMTSLLTTTILLELNMTPVYDRYGRIVAKVHNGTINTINEKMIESGLAMVDLPSGVIKDPFLITLVELEKKAKESKLGIWKYQEGII